MIKKEVMTAKKLKEKAIEEGEIVLNGLNDISKVLNEKFEGARVPPYPHKELIVFNGINEFNQFITQLCKEQREICASRVKYKGEISKAECFSLGNDELLDKCEELCINAPNPET